MRQLSRNFAICNFRAAQMLVWRLPTSRVCKIFIILTADPKEINSIYFIIKVNNAELGLLNLFWYLFTHRPLRWTPHAGMRGGGRGGCVMWAVVGMLQLLLLLLLVLALQVIHEGVPLTFHVSFVEVGQGLQALGSCDCVAMLWRVHQANIWEAPTTVAQRAVFPRILQVISGY